MRILSLCLSAALILLSPGTGSYRAFALVAGRSAAQAAPGGLPGAAVGAAPLAPADAIAPLAPGSLGLMSVETVLPGLETALPAAAAATAVPAPARAQALPAEEAAGDAPAALAAPRRAHAQTAALSREVGAAIEAAGPLGQAAPASAHGLGVRL